MLRRRLVTNDPPISLDKKDDGKESSPVNKTDALNLRKSYTSRQASKRKSAKKQVDAPHVEQIVAQSSSSLLETFSQGVELEAVVLGAEDELLDELEKTPTTRSRKVLFTLY